MTQRTPNGLGTCFVIGIVRDHLYYIEKLIERVDFRVNTMIEKYDGAVSLLCAIPGIDCSSAIYSMLATGEIWNPVDLFKVDMPENLKERQVQKAVRQAVRFLEAQGLKVS